MTEHVTQELADYLNGRLTPDRRREVDAHVEACGECAAELAFATRLVDSARSQGIAHLHPDRIVALADAPAGATSAERDHLEACDACRAELGWAANVSTGHALDLAVAERPPAPRHLWSRLWVPAGAALAVAAAVAIVFIGPRFAREASDPAGLIEARPLPVRFSRSAAPTDSFDSARLGGLEAYQEGDYRAARVRFGEALAIRPDDAETLLYAGSTALLLDDPAGAAPLLETGLQHTDRQPLREQLYWHLADARLELGDIGAARDALEEVSELGQGRAQAARRLLKALQ